MLQPGAPCWCRTPDQGWVLGSVAGREGACIRFRPEDPPGVERGGIAPAGPDCIPTTPEHAAAEPDDFCALPRIHDAAVQHCIRRRLRRGLLCTAVGQRVTVVCRPLRPSAAAPSGASGLHRIAERAWRAAADGAGPQCLVVTGAPGAGKTEAAQRMLRAAAAAAAAVGSPEQRRSAVEVVRRAGLLAPALELWVSAAAADGGGVSSRATTVLHAHFDRAGALRGTGVEVLLADLGCADPTPSGSMRFCSLSRGGAGLCADDVQEEVYAALLESGVGPEAAAALRRIAEAISTLHSAEGGPGAASLLGVDPVELQAVLAPPEGAPAGSAEQRRAAACRALYSTCLDALAAAGSAACSPPTGSVDGGFVISFVDCCGVAAAAEGGGGAEALIAHLAAEVVQHHHNSYNFQRLIDDCRAEGVPHPRPAFADNSPCLRTLSGRGGVLSLMDDEVACNGGSEQGFAARLLAAHGSSPVLSCAADGEGGGELSVKHYNGDVTYRLGDFVASNGGAAAGGCAQGITALLSVSSDPSVAALFADRPAPAPTRAAQARAGLLRLMGVLSHADPRWARCVRLSGAGGAADGAGLHRQLVAGEVAELAKLHAASFPVRYAYPAFAARYRLLLTPGPGANAGARPDSAAALRAAGIDAATQARAGRTMLFLSEAADQQLQQRREAAHAAAARQVQGACRGAIAALRARRKAAEGHTALAAAIRDRVQQRNRARREREEAARAAAATAEAARVALGELPAAEEAARVELRRQRRDELGELLLAADSGRAAALLVSCELEEAAWRQWLAGGEEQRLQQLRALLAGYLDHSAAVEENAARGLVRKEEHAERLALGAAAAAEYFAVRLIEEERGEEQQRDGIEWYASEGGALLLWHACEGLLYCLTGAAPGAGEGAEPAQRAAVEQAERRAARELYRQMAGVYALQAAAELCAEEELARRGHRGVGGIITLEQQAWDHITRRRVPEEIRFIAAQMLSQQPGREAGWRRRIEDAEAARRRELRRYSTIIAAPHWMRHVDAGPQREGRLRIAIAEHEQRRTLRAQRLGDRAALLAGSGDPNGERARRLLVEKQQRDAKRTLLSAWRRLRAEWTESRVRALLEALSPPQQQEIAARRAIATERLRQLAALAAPMAAPLPDMMRRWAEWRAELRGGGLREAELARRVADAVGALRRQGCAVQHSVDAAAGRRLAAACGSGAPPPHPPQYRDAAARATASPGWHQSPPPAPRGRCAGR